MVLNVIIFGDYWYVFWVGQIGLAWAVPLVIGSLPGVRHRPAMLGLAGACAVIGIVAVRLNLVIPAYLHPQLPGLPTAYEGARLAYDYFPSMWEWLSSQGLLAALVLGFVLFWRFLPLYELTLGGAEAERRA